MKHFKLISAAPIILSIAACTNTGASYQPVIDGPVGPNYGADLAYCQNLAAQQGALSSDTAGKAAAGAGVAAASTAVFANEGNNVRDAAILGAAAGVTAGALDQNSKKEAIIRNCMAQRGYKVVG
ncbi:glycine zipper family protein [Halocynthiibacter sp. C4]|uniref:glycine zipper family protein n=1 Tax=Halocynthiibacter sp. C4 TaxID=2992758 RepID=UPI00237B8543|nr:glycine zipper family protein [Halocynthiibacter sp. C4]MDE0590100.1 glycine zipper family protein [Halocynthiibacter sp. C4]